MVVKNPVALPAVVHRQSSDPRLDLSLRGACRIEVRASRLRRDTGDEKRIVIES